MRIEFFCDMLETIGQKGLYKHYSKRDIPPRVSDREGKSNVASAGTITGVWAYPAEFQQNLYATDRPWVFTLKPTGKVLSSRNYTREQLDADLKRLTSICSIDRALEVWTKMGKRNQLASYSGIPFAKFWYIVTHITNSKDDEAEIDYWRQQGGGDHHFTKDVLIRLGYPVIDDRDSVIFNAEPEQAVFLTDDSFEVISKEKNPRFKGFNISNTPDAIQSSFDDEPTDPDVSPFGSNLNQ